MGKLILDAEGNPAAPATGKARVLVNSTSKRLVVVKDTGEIETVGGSYNQSTANQTGFATDTYLAGSAIAMQPGSPRIGTTYRLRWDMVKTAFGTAATAINVRFGTAGTVADTARLTFTFGTGTAAIDTGCFELICHWRNVGASSVLVGVCRLWHHLAATGLTNTGAAGNAIILVTSAAFDSALAGAIIGVSFNGGSSFAGTNTVQQARLTNC